MSVHYVANLKVEKVTKPERPGSPTMANSRDTIKSEREVDEVTQMTIKADSLDSLVGKLIQHLGIVSKD